eukprot:754357-Hanusia_phi.AAC.2
MGASFRSVGEVEERREEGGGRRRLTGCDRLTISPALLQEMDKMNDEVRRRVRGRGKRERTGGRKAGTSKCDSRAQVPVKLQSSAAKTMDLQQVFVDEKKFRWEMNQVG